MNEYKEALKKMFKEHPHGIPMILRRSLKEDGVFYDILEELIEESDERFWKKYKEKEILIDQKKEGVHHG